MAKFYGNVGYGVQVETALDVYTEEIVPHPHRGDIVRNYTRWENGESLNDNLNVSNSISIVADPFALTHFNSIKWVEWMGAKWKVTGIEVAYPRIILQVGGVWNDKDES